MIKKTFSTFVLVLSIGMFWILGNFVDATAQQSRKIILAGYKHKPPVSTSGSGLATVTLHGDTLTVSGEFENLTANFSGGYIMVSIKEQGGNQLYRLNVDLNDEDKTSGTIRAKENRFILTKAEKELLKEGALYINIASFENPNGELRGNIGPMGK